jgi:MscS family membrane protein
MNWDELIFGNSLKAYMGFLVVLVLGLVFSGLFARFFSWLAYKLFKRLSKGKFFDEFHRLLHKPFSQLVQLLILYAAFNQLSFPEEWNFVSVKEFGLRWFLHAIFLIALILVWMRLFKRGIDFTAYVYTHSEDSVLSADLVVFIKSLAHIIIYILGFFVILAKAFEVNITAVITSLGIGGLAIALAAQDTLANLIGSFIIYIDKPFNVGDVVELGEVKGVVEKIGFRTTRIRTMEKSLLHVPNKKIVDSNLNNISQSSQRRVHFNLALNYKSKPEDIMQIIAEIKKAIQQESPLTGKEMTVRLVEFDASSLNILVIYFVNTIDFDLMVELKEKINLRIMEIVKNFNCEFAYPTQTVIVQN